MKKRLKLLVFALSLALVFCAVTVIAAAEGSFVSETLTASDVANAKDGVITLNGNTTIGSTITLTDDLTINLNGYKLTATVSPAFEITAEADFMYRSVRNRLKTAIPRPISALGTSFLTSFRSRTSMQRS